MRSAYINSDIQGRAGRIIEPDGSVSEAFYDEVKRPSSASTKSGKTVRVVDTWGRSRWELYDRRNKLVEVVEPDPNANGDVFEPGNTSTKYTFDVLSRLTKTEQGNQTRSIEYDSLSRVIRQKLAEQTATLNEAGVYVGSGNC